MDKEVFKDNDYFSFDMDFRFKKLILASWIEKIEIDVRPHYLQVYSKITKTCTYVY